MPAGYIDVFQTSVCFLFVRSTSSACAPSLLLGKRRCIPIDKQRAPCIDRIMRQQSSLHERRVRQAVVALLTAAEANPDAARRALTNRDAVGPSYAELLTTVLAGARDPRAVAPMQPGGARWVVDAALDALAARLTAEPSPALGDLVGPMCGLLLLPYASLGAVANAIASAPPTTGATASTTRSGASAGSAAASPRRTRSAQSSKAPAATALATVSSTFEPAWP